MNTKIFILASLLLTSSAYAQTPSTTTSAVAAQANITRDSINDILNKIGSNSISGYEAADYHAQIPTFKAQAAQAMEEFQIELENNILKKIDFWVSRYNAIYQSPDYSNDQKVVLLAQQRSVIDGQLLLIQPDYQAAVKKVYQIFRNLPVNVRNIHANEWGRNGFFGGNTEFIADLYMTIESLNAVQEIKRKAHTRNFKVSITWTDDAWIQQHPFVLLSNFDPEFATKLYLETAYSLFSEGCRSQICLGLKASDYGSLLTMVSQSIDRDLQIKLADGNVVVLKSQKMNPKLAQELLTNINYPAEGKALPFDTK